MDLQARVLDLTVVVFYLSIADNPAAQGAGLAGLSALALAALARRVQDIRAKKVRPEDTHDAKCLVVEFVCCSLHRKLWHALSWHPRPC